MGLAPLEPLAASRLMVPLRVQVAFPLRKVLPVLLVFRPQAARRKVLPVLLAFRPKAARQELLPALRAPVPLVLPQQALWQQVLPALRALFPSSLCTCLFRRSIRNATLRCNQSR
jgi:hypothetical protein